MDKETIIDIDIEQFAYPDSHKVLDALHIEVERGSITGIMGTNGCGKSTLLNLMYGTIAGGQLKIIKRINDSRIEMVHQNYRESLFQWKSAFENICLPTYFANGNTKCKETVNDLTTIFNIGFDLRKRPGQLSGGEQQKVVVLRSLMSNPKLLLLDEPCSAMDYASRYLFLRQLRKKINNEGITSMMISHTAEDIFIFCDKLILLTSNGTIGKTIEDCQSKDKMVTNLDTINEFFNNKK
jgi:NitT/TauT family transport system ATP-binding protein